MTLALSVIIAGVGAGILYVSIWWGAGHNSFVAAALLADTDTRSQETGRPEYRDTTAVWAPFERLKFWAFGAGMMLALQLTCGSTSFVGIAVALCGGMFGGELYRSRRRDHKAKQRIRRMELYLPTVMERVVMGVGTGLDVIPALREAAAKSDDPVSELLRGVVSLSEAGIPVEAAFDAAAKQAGCTSVKHALIHLGLAHRQGGEIIRPLKELSDATQLAYQEIVEEQIARLPVKAVMPLVVTFAGLIVCFLTVPLMQVSSLTRTIIDEAR
jgi:Flp pilus assembly protein TadB